MKSRHGFPSLLTVRLFFLFCLLAVNPSWAAEWWLEPALSLGAQYDDNPALTSFAHTSSHGTTISPRVDFGARSLAWQVNGSAGLTRRSYSNENSLGRDSENYAWSTQYNPSERTSFRLDGNLAYASSLVSEASPDPDVGIVVLNKQRKTSGYAPSWTWSMTELTQLNLGYQKTSVSYKDGLRFGLFDNDSHGVTGGLGYQVSPQSRVFVNLGYSIFDVPENSFESNTRNLQGGVSHNFSETLSASLAIGAQKTASEGIVRRCLQRGVFTFVNGQLFFNPNACAQFGDIFVNQDNTSSTLSASLAKQFTVTNLSASLSRSLNTSGFGTLVQTDAFNLQISRSFSSLLTGSLAISAVDYRSIFGDLTTDDRTFYQVSPSLNWQWTEKLSVGTSLSYRRFKPYSEPQAAATGRAIYLTVTYRGSRKSISR